MPPFPSRTPLSAPTSLAVNAGPDVRCAPRGQELDPDRGRGTSSPQDDLQIAPLAIGSWSPSPVARLQKLDDQDEIRLLKAQQVPLPSDSQNLRCWCQKVYLQPKYQVVAAAQSQVTQVSIQKTCQTQTFQDCMLRMNHMLHMLHMDHIHDAPKNTSSCAEASVQSWSHAPGVPRSQHNPPPRLWPPSDCSACHPATWSTETNWSFSCTRMKSSFTLEISGILAEGSLEVKFPTIWTDEKQRWKGSERREEKKRRSEKRKSQEKEDAGARKGRKVAKHGVFPMICGPGGPKSRLAKAAGAEPAGQMRDEKLHPVVALSTCRSQSAQSKPTSDRFWKLWCLKSARRCGAKHMSKSTCTKHLSFGAL